MKKLLLVILGALLLASCQQPTMPFSVEEYEQLQTENEQLKSENGNLKSDLEDVKTENESLQEEHRAKVEEYEVAFEELKNELLNKRSVFETKITSRSSLDDCYGGTFRNISHCFDHYLDWWNIQVVHKAKVFVFYEGKVVSESSLFEKAIEMLEKEKAEVEAQVSEINFLIEKIENIFDDNVNLEVIAAEKIELENKIANLEIIDVQALSDKYVEVCPYIFFELVEVK